MSIQRLKTLVAVAEHGSFSSAADSVHLTPSAISLQMKSLEQEFGVELFDRGKRPPVLNELGWAVTPRIREIIEAYDTLLRSASDESALGGEFRLGAVPSTMSSLVPQALTGFRQSYPNYNLVITPGSSPELVSLVDANQLDAAVVNEPPYLSKHMSFRPFVEEPLIMLTPQDCTLTDYREILRQYPLIRFSRALWAGQWVESWLREENISVKKTMEIGNQEMINAMVYYNLGVAITPHSCMPPPNPLPLRRISLGPTSPRRILGVMTSRNSLNQRLADAFFDQIERLVQTIYIATSVVS